MHLLFLKGPPLQNCLGKIFKTLLKVDGILSLLGLPLKNLPDKWKRKIKDNNVLNNINWKKIRGKLLEIYNTNAHKSLN